MSTKSPCPLALEIPAVAMKWLSRFFFLLIKEAEAQTHAYTGIVFNLA